MGIEQMGSIMPNPLEGGNKNELLLSDLTDHVYNTLLEGTKIEDRINNLNVTDTELIQEEVIFTLENATVCKATITSNKDTFFENLKNEIKKEIANNGMQSSGKIKSMTSSFKVLIENNEESVRGDSFRTIV